MELDFSLIKDLKQKFVEEISSFKNDLLSIFPVDTYIQSLDDACGYGGYGSFHKEAYAFYNQIMHQTGSQILERYHKLVLLNLIEDFDRRLSLRRIPESIVQLFTKEFQRIISEMKIDRKDFYLYPNDVFIKELGICRLKLYPCGPELIDEQSGVPRSILLRGNIFQLMEKVKFFNFTLNGFRPFYELHMHLPLRKYFNPNEWLDCYRRISELLDLNPNVKGISCTSWWYDPQLESISPRLSYLREQSLNGGAQLFYVGKDKHAVSGAITKSQTRRQLYHSGQYIPHMYTMVWGRNELADWVEKTRDK